MKYYSETLKKVFDSENELVEAEKKAEEEKAALEVRKSEAAKEKKSYALAVQDADKEIEKAYNDLKAAQDKASEIVKQRAKEIDEILTPARKALADARAKKREALVKFNTKYGPYVRYYTSDDDEVYDRVSKIIDSFFDSLWL